MNAQAEIARLREYLGVPLYTAQAEIAKLRKCVGLDGKQIATLKAERASLEKWVDEATANFKQATAQRDRLREALRSALSSSEVGHWEDARRFIRAALEGEKK